MRTYRDMISITADAKAINVPDPDYSGDPLYDDVPCKISNVSGLETVRGRQLQAECTHLVELHYLPDIEPTMRISVTGGVFNGRTLGITAIREIDEDGKPQRLELSCKELAA